MDTITIRKAEPEGSKLIVIDVDGSTVWAETDKDEIKKIVTILLTSLLVKQERTYEKL